MNTLLAATSHDLNARFTNPLPQFEMLKEEIVHYKNLVGTKEKELGNLTVAFNQNMSENKNEVRMTCIKTSSVGNVHRISAISSSSRLLNCI